MQKRKLLPFIGTLLGVVLLVTACQQQPLVQTVEVERVVTLEVERVVTQEVLVTQEVEAQAPAGSNLISLTARCKAAPPYENGRCNNLLAAVGATNAELAASGDNRRIELVTIQDDADWGDYKTEFELAAEAREAPDIIVSGHEHIGDWATADYIVDITDEVDKYPEFADVIDSLWESATLNDRIWGVPQDAEARPLFFSKLLLRELGWTEEEIESLPDRVAACEYSWQDMLDTAEQAVEAGLVEPGNGWWHRPANGPDFLYFYYAAGGEVTEEGEDALVFDTEAALKVYELLYDAAQVRNILRPDRLDGDWDSFRQETSTFDKVLFVFEGTWRWAGWHTNYLQDLGGEDYLWENVGFAPIPCREDGPQRAWTLTHPLVYMVSTQAEHPDLALLLISKATVKELNTDYAVASGHLGILESQSDYPSYVTAKFLSETLPLLEYTTFLPNSPYWSAYSEAYYLGIQAVESGDLTPEEAVDVVIDQLQNELGDNVIIR